MKYFTLKRLAAVLLSLSALCESASAAPSLRGRTVNLGNGGWSWYSDPRAVYSNGTIFTGWVERDSDGNSDIVVGSHNISSAVTRKQKIADNLPYSGPATGPYNDHHNPAFLVEPDGRITVYYAAHNGPEIYARTTINPGDVTSWGPEVFLRTTTNGSININTGINRGFSYVNPFRLGNTRYMFFRAGNWAPAYSTTSGSNTGSGWSVARTLVRNNTPGLQNQRPYVKYISNGTDKIFFAYSDANPGDDTNPGDDGTVTDDPNDPLVKTSIYAAYIQNGNYYRLDGTLIRSLANGPMNTDEGTLLYSGRNPSTNPSAWVYDIALMNGQPVIAWAVYPPDANSPSSFNHHSYRWSRWTGSQFVHRVLFADAGGPIATDLTCGYCSGQRFYSGGISLDKADPRTVFLSVQSSVGWALWMQKTINDGASWSYFMVNSGGVGGKAIRPVAISGLPATIDAVAYMWGTYTNYTNFNTSAMLWFNRDVARLGKVDKHPFNNKPSARRRIRRK